METRRWMDDYRMGLVDSLQVYVRARVRLVYHSEDAIGSRGLDHI